MAVALLGMISGTAGGRDLGVCSSMRLVRRLKSSSTTTVDWERVRVRLNWEGRLNCLPLRRLSSVSKSSEASEMLSMIPT